jgi:ABC-type antimicrobial peptide transport system permease subunit
LVVLQFTCSVALIISTVIIYQQIQYAKDRPTGYDISRLVTSDMNDELYKNYTPLKDELMAKGIVSAVTTASSPATNIWWHTDIDQWPGKNAGETIEMGNILVTEDYFKTLGMTVVDGRNFKDRYDSTSVMFNEAAIKRMRIQDPVNQKITWGGKQYTIAGVVKDALMLSPFGGADPTMFFCVPDPQGVIMYRLSSHVKTADAIASITSIFNKYNPSFPFTYSFADAAYARKFSLEVLIGKLAGLFAALAIFISCLGLFGLAAYVAEQRRKEIGVRKVLGASVRQVWMLLSRDFVLLVIISCIVAAPVSYYFLRNWLMNYEYRISIGTGVFIGSALAALGITVLTISFQAIKAAMANPVKSLRTE